MIKSRMQTSNAKKYIDGSILRAEAQRKGITTSQPHVCCGGKISYPKNYSVLLKALGYTGTVVVTERGIIRAIVNMS